MGKKSIRTKRKKELKIIFFIILVAAALFIISTYAWFTTQKNVSITNLKGTVEVAEGLEISLDAKTWSNGIVLGTEEGQVDIVSEEGQAKNLYPGHTTLMPREMLPVSTLGKVTTDAQGKPNMSALSMLRGKLTNSIVLSDIKAVKESDSALEVGTKDYELLYPGFFAFDIFLKNSSKSTKIADVLQLNYDSSLQIIEADNAITGLQNTVRVGFARFGGTVSYEEGGKGVADVMAGQADVLALTGAAGDDKDTVYIEDVAIWEPNAGDHADYIVQNNNTITWTADDAKLYDTYKITETDYGFGTTTQIPTYALKEASIGKKIENIYLWDGSNSATMEKQITLQTNKTSDTDYSLRDGVKDLISSNTGSDFVIPPQSICRVRVYVWLEGQDVDTINYASHGGGVIVNIGLVKGSDDGFNPTEE